MRELLIIALFAVCIVGCDDDDNEETLTGPDVTVTTQVDRVGLPAINTVFIPSGSKEDYNRGAPATDRARFGDFVVDFLVNVTGRTQQDAEALRDVLLPDVLTIDMTQPTAFLNGRAPTDDVVTGELMLLFGGNGDLNDDHVDANDRAFSDQFPYLAEPFTQ